MNHKVAWIQVESEQADPRLQELARLVADPETGEVDHIMQVHSLHPAGMRAHFELYRAVMRSTATLRKVDRELIAFVVSKLNGCEY